MRVDQQYLKETFLSPQLALGDYVYLEINDNGCGMVPEVPMGTPLPRKTMTLPPTRSVSGCSRRNCAAGRVAPGT